MKRALVIGASGGIGSAVTGHLRELGVETHQLSRKDDGLEVTSEPSVASAFEQLDGTFDLIFVATGALVIEGHEPERALKDLSGEGLTNQFLTNAMGPALILKHGLRLLPKDRRAVFAVLSARVGSIGDNKLGGWHSYRASKAALNQLMHGAAIELKRTHKQAIVLCLHPGTVATAFTEKYAGRHKTVSPEVAAGDLLQVIINSPAEQSGTVLDYAGQQIPW